ncbi:MAG: hypothetical protein ACE5PO_02715 [Candidatus Bathyarchaeia archaeon]
MKYLALAVHPPQACPSSNAAVKDSAKKALSNLESVSKKHNVKIEGSYVLTPSHKLVLVADAPNVEAFNRLLMEVGLTQWNEIEVYPTWSLQEAMKETDALEPIKW